MKLFNVIRRWTAYGWGLAFFGVLGILDSYDSPLGLGMANDPPEVDQFWKIAGIALIAVGAVIFIAGLFAGPLPPKPGKGEPKP